MIPDSMNPRQMAENILELQRKIEEAGSELPTPGVGDTGKILKVGSEGYELSTEYSYTPPVYSTSEVNTGEKFIGGEELYRISFEGSLPEIAATTSPILATISNITPVKFEILLKSQTTSYQPSNTVSYNHSTGNVSLLNVVAAYSEYGYLLTVYYYKNPEPALDVVPAPDNDTRSVEHIEEVTEEPVQETKTTRKRSTSSK